MRTSCTETVHGYFNMSFLYQRLSRLTLWHYQYRAYFVSESLLKEFFIIENFDDPCVCAIRRHSNASMCLRLRDRPHWRWFGGDNALNIQHYMIMVIPGMFYLINVAWACVYAYIIPKPHWHFLSVKISSLNYCIKRDILIIFSTKS